MEAPRSRSRARPAADDIGLDELISAFTARWWLFVSFAVIAVSAAGWYGTSRPLLFEFRTGVEIGYVYLGEQREDERVRTLDTVEMARARLEDYIVPAIRRDWRAAGRVVPTVTVEERGGGASLLLSSAAPESIADDVAELHRMIGERLAETHESVLRRQVALLQRPLNARATVLEQQVAAVDAQLATLQRGDLPSGDADAALVALINAQRTTDLGREYVALLGELAEARAEAEALEAGSLSTRLAFVASRSDRPISIATPVLIGLALVFSLLLAALLALIWELVVRVHRGDRSPPSVRSNDPTPS